MEEVISNRSKLLKEWALNPIGECDSYVDDRLLLYVVYLN